jgi:hypothetical protein
MYTPTVIYTHRIKIEISSHNQQFHPKNRSLPNQQFRTFEASIKLEKSGLLTIQKVVENLALFPDITTIPKIEKGE